MCPRSLLPPSAELNPGACAEPAQAPYPPELGPCRFADPQPLLGAAAVAGLSGIACRGLLLDYELAAEEWWGTLATMPDSPVAVRAGVLCGVLLLVGCSRGGLPALPCPALSAHLHAAAGNVPAERCGREHSRACQLPFLQAALAKLRGSCGTDAQLEERARQLAEQRLRERGWLRPDGSVCCPGNGAWLITARRSD